MLGGSLPDYELFVYALQDSFASILVSTLPHHKHIPPNIKHHRIPAPQLSFTRPNLPFLIADIERELLDR